MSAGSVVAAERTLSARGVLGRLWAGRNRYLIGAICLALSAVMLTPLVLTILASFKSTSEAAASPPVYLPSAITLDSYERLWTYQAGLPTYLGNSLGTALITIGLVLALTIPAAYALARFPIPVKEVLFIRPASSHALRRHRRGRGLGRVRPAVGGPRCRR